MKFSGSAAHAAGLALTPLRQASTTKACWDGHYREIPGFILPQARNVLDERMARGISSIATLLAADVADPSRLSGADRPERAQILHARRELFQRIVVEHGGLCHATTGTKMVVEFPTPVDAVRCAVAVQSSFPVKNGEDL